MKKLTVLSIFFLLAACLPAPQTQVTVAPTVTLTPTAIPTLTLTPIPTATISPQFVALQEQIAQSEVYTLNADGQVEMQTSEGMVIVPDILFSKDGTMTVTHNGETSEADATKIVIVGQKITFRDKENRTWLWDGENLKEEIREFVPANGVVFTESLSDIDPKLNSQAKQDKIYWDVIMSKIMDTKSIDENKEIHAQILANEELMKKHPEWKELSNNLPKESKKEYMTEFLKRSGGLMVIKDRKWQYHTIDFNEKIKFTVEEVPVMTNEYSNIIYNSIGFKHYAGEDGEMIFSIMTTKGVIAESTNKKGQSLWGNLTEGQLISTMFWYMISGSVLGGDIIMNTTDYKLYVDINPSNPSYYLHLYWSFIK